MSQTAQGHTCGHVRPPTTTTAPPLGPGASVMSTKGRGHGPARLLPPAATSGPHETPRADDRAPGLGRAPSTESSTRGVAARPPCTLRQAAYAPHARLPCIMTRWGRLPQPARPCSDLQRLAVARLATAVWPPRQPTTAASRRPRSDLIACGMQQAGSHTSVEV